jgi:hypothetical protein
VPESLGGIRHDSVAGRNFARVPLSLPIALEDGYHTLTVASAGLSS